MTPLIDGDILAYEIPFALEYGRESYNLPQFDSVYDLLVRRIEEICAAVEATEPPKIFLTGPGNFREEVAKTKPYKGTRLSNKPFHYDNIRAVLVHVLGAEIVTGYEADDAMAMSQTETTIICSRDKDLRMVPGWHYGWEVGKQPEFHPRYISVEGYLEINKDKKKLEGGGLKFFFSQMLTGDDVDNIPGCKGVGYVGAFNLLDPLSDPLEMEQVVWDTYLAKHADKSLEEVREVFMEQSKLLWMIQEKTDEGELVFWEPSIELAQKEG